LADSVLLLRFFEVAGTVRRAISALKKRSGPHEHTIREMQMSPQGIQIGEQLAGFTGILSGTPEYRDLQERQSEEPNDGGKR